VRGFESWREPGKCANYFHQRFLSCTSILPEFATGYGHCQNPDALYWAGINGVMFLLRGGSSRSRGRHRTFRKRRCLWLPYRSADAPAVVGAIPRQIAILLKKSLFEYPIVDDISTWRISFRWMIEARLGNFHLGKREAMPRANVLDLSGRDGVGRAPATIRAW
jgi:hypothetical protein